MNNKRLKSSVVLEPYESKRSPHKDDSRTNVSTFARSDASNRKWKVSESITPIMSELDRFSLRILSENSFNNGSLNESFEKNLKFNLQNSLATSYSSDSRNKKVSISAAPLVKFIVPVIESEINVIKDTQTIVEVPDVTDEVNVDVDDVPLSSFAEEEVGSKSPSFMNSVPKEEVLDGKETIENLQPPTEPYLYPTRINRQAKKYAKEKIEQQCKEFNEIINPVDIDAAESPIISRIKITQNKPQNLSVNEKPCIPLDIPSGQQSKLCDVSKAYIMSQDSSLISSPMEKDIMKSAISLPGRSSYVPPISVDANLPSPIRFADISNSKNEDQIKKPPFFKSSFTERRLCELKKFNNSIEIIPNVESKSKIIPKPRKAPLKKTVKEKGAKKNKTQPVPKESKGKIKGCTKPRDDHLCTMDSTKDQIKAIVIEDSGNDKFEGPIEKMRGSPVGSNDDLFSFTPEMVPKRKRKVVKKAPTKSKRKSSSSTVYDIISELSSPSPVRLSYSSFKSAQNESRGRLGDEVIGRRSSLKSVMDDFGSDLNQLKTVVQSLSYQFDQFKDIAKKYSF